MRFKITEKNSQLFPYKQHAWHVYADKLNKKHLTKVFQYIETMLLSYSRVMVLRVDLFPQKFNANNKHIMQCLDKLTQYLSSKYQCKCSYICAREQNSSSREHYHLALLLSRHKIKHPDSLLKLIKHHWLQFDGGSIHIPKNCYYMLIRGIKLSIENAIYRLSYLTKTKSKELNPKGVSDVIFSRLSIPEAINQGCNDILLVDNRYNPPLPRIRVLPLLYSTSEPRLKTVNIPCTSFSVLGAAHTHEKPILTGNNLAMDSPAYHYKEWMQ